MKASRELLRLYIPAYYLSLQRAAASLNALGNTPQRLTPTVSDAIYAIVTVMKSIGPHTPGKTLRYQS